MWEELKVYLQDQEEEYLCEAEMYRQNEQEVFVNPDELAWGAQCKANMCMLTLMKMKRLEESMK